MEFLGKVYRWCVAQWCYLFCSLLALKGLSETYQGQWFFGPLEMLLACYAAYFVWTVRDREHELAEKLELLAVKEKLEDLEEGEK